MSVFQPSVAAAIKPADFTPQSGLETVEPAVAPVTPPAAAPVSPITTCGDNEYANFIYMHESGCRTDAINPIGACGIGQALPCAKLGCSLADYACQNQFFTNYANTVYGGWYPAYQHWLAYAWW